MNQDRLIINKYNIVKNNWHKMNVILNNSKEYKKGLIKIFSGSEKDQIFPVLKLPDIIFTKLNKINNIEELNKLLEFNIYFKTRDAPMIQTYSINLNIKIVKIIKVDEREVKKEVDVWRLRKFYNLEYINYYLEELYTDFGVQNQLFVNKFVGEYKIFSHMHLLDSFFSKNKIDATKKFKINEMTNINESFDILYLTNESIQYEKTGYTMRSHNLVKNLKNKACIVTKLGYPYDFDYKKEYINKIDNVHYFNIGTKDDILKTNNLIDYIQKYIIEIVKLCTRLKVKIVHACSNYLNGIVAIYAAKHLNLKVIYEVRDFQDELSYLSRPEIYDSDLLKLRHNLENYVLNNCNYIIVSNNKIYDMILTRNLNITNKIGIIMDGVDVENSETNNNKICLFNANLESDLIIDNNEANFKFINKAIYNDSKYSPILYKLLAYGVTVFVPNNEEYADIFNDICVLRDDLSNKINEEIDKNIIKDWIKNNMSWEIWANYLDDLYYDLLKQ